MSSVTEHEVLLIGGDELIARVLRCTPCLSELVGTKTIESVA